MEIYPAYLEFVESESSKQQSWRFWTLRAQLGPLIAIPVIEVAAVLYSNINFPYYILVLLSLLISLFATILENNLKFEENWFKCRAIAENLKQLCWDYACNTLPVPEADSPDTVFIRKFTELEKRVQAIGDSIAVPRDTSPLITNKMKSLRSEAWQTQMETYVSARLSDQIKWYSKKSSYNKKATNFYSIATILLELTAIIVVAAEMHFGSTLHVWQLVPAVAMALISWNLARRHKDLATTYSVAASDLSNLKTLSSTISTEAEFKELVTRAEESISREHYIWLSLTGRASISK
jgi:hypothetical protein